MNSDPFSLLQQYYHLINYFSLFPLHHKIILLQFCQRSMNLAKKDWQNSFNNRKVYFSSVSKKIQVPCVLRQANVIYVQRIKISDWIFWKRSKRVLGTSLISICNNKTIVTWQIKVYLEFVGVAMFILSPEQRFNDFTGEMRITRVTK